MNHESKTCSSFCVPVAAPPPPPSDEINRESRCIAPAEPANCSAGLMMRHTSSDPRPFQSVAADSIAQDVPGYQPARVAVQAMQFVEPSRNPDNAASPAHFTPNAGDLRACRTWMFMLERGFVTPAVRDIVAKRMASINALSRAANWSQEAPQEMAGEGVGVAWPGIDEHALKRTEFLVTNVLDAAKMGFMQL
jgi:hypothetical protein